MLLSRDQAQRLADAYIKDHSRLEDDEPVIVESATIEKDYGWIFFYQSRKHLETLDLDYALLGNGPLVVEKEGGVIHTLGTALEPEVYIAEYERQRKHTAK